MKNVWRRRWERGADLSVTSPVSLITRLFYTIQSHRINNVKQSIRRWMTCIEIQRWVLSVISGFF